MLGFIAGIPMGAMITITVLAFLNRLEQTAVIIIGPFISIWLIYVAFYLV